MTMIAIRERSGTSLAALAALVALRCSLALEGATDVHAVTTKSTMKVQARSFKRKRVSAQAGFRYRSGEGWRWGST
jgi:hypothetical protein